MPVYSSYAHDTLPIHILMPWDQRYPPGSSAETVNSAPFTIPRGALATTVSAPALTGAATMLLQKLYQPRDDQQTESWLNVSVFNLSDGTFTQLDGIPGGATTTLPGAATGGGVFRLVATASQASAPVIIQLDVLITI